MVAQTSADIGRLRAYTRALASGRRLRILGVIAENHSLTVAELSELVSISQPLVSWHLRRLRGIGLVERRRAGREVRYSLAPGQMLAEHGYLTEYIEHIAGFGTDGRTAKAKLVRRRMSANKAGR